MGGGLMQLVAYGSQDLYLTGNPQITFFKIVYRRHTNFAIEQIEHTFDGTVGFGKEVSAKITRNGDLITKMYLRIKLPYVNPQNSKFAWVRRIGHAIVKQVEVEIGGSKIDRQYGTWLDIWYELARQGDHERGYANMIGDIHELTGYNKHAKSEYILYVPLQFWFNRFVGLSIPLIALQYHDVRINVSFENLEKLVIKDCNFCELNNIILNDATLLTSYVYLDTDERRRFAIVGHEYLIEQLQFNGVEQVVEKEQKYILDYNHPTKEIFWAIKNGNFSSGKSFIYYTDGEWNLKKASKCIIKKSLSVGYDPSYETNAYWYPVEPNKMKTIGTFNINNKSLKTIYVNPSSLKINDYGITDKIHANIVIEMCGKVKVKYIETDLTIRDISIPVELMCDTRYNQCDPCVTMFNNYGLLIDGTHNPVSYALLQFNGYDRFDRREGIYFNNVQPEQHHSNTPVDGINCYSFSLYPEEHQPSGTANFSRIDRTQLTLWFNDNTYENDLPELGYFNNNNQLYIFAVNYNVFRIYSGISGIAYVA